MHVSAIQVFLTQPIMISSCYDSKTGVDSVCEAWLLYN